MKGSQKFTITDFKHCTNMSTIKENNTLIPVERIASKILLIRGEKVMLDFHLAELYDIQTRVLKQAVKRNLNRFPSDFMFELTEDEIITLVSQNVIPSKIYLGGAIPFDFYETGVSMLSSILKSNQAVAINIAIIRTFVMLRKMINNYEELLNWQSLIESKLGAHDEQIMLLFEYFRQFEQDKLQEFDQRNRPKIGYKKMNDKDTDITT
jgi:hypothetical protein